MYFPAHKTQSCILDNLPRSHDEIIIPREFCDFSWTNGSLRAFTRQHGRDEIFFGLC